MRKLLIFGGTSEEHGLLKALESFRLDITLCVASDYGKALLPAGVPSLTVRAGRMDETEMAGFLRSGNFFCVVDATHPYAVEVTKNIKAAAAEAGVRYLRCLRSKSEAVGTVTVDSSREAAKYLNGTSGNVLLTTGSKDLALFAAVRDFRERLYPRVLPTADSINACLMSGYPAQHIIAMHGPFSRELNIALMRQFAIRTVVTKDGGKEGGFPEKLEAARELGAEVVVIRRPDEDGLTPDAVLAEISKLTEGRP